jgi:hypothetical protein
MDCNSVLLDTLNNATVAGLVSIITGLFFASIIYKKQKKVDRQFSAQDELCKRLLLLREHCEAVCESLNMIVTTWIVIVSKQGIEEQKKFISESMQDELRRGHDFLMYKIPEDRSSILSVTELYFSDNKDILQKVQDVLLEVKKWHDEIMKYELDGDRFPRKKTYELSELSLDNINLHIKSIYNSFTR